MSLGCVLTFENQDHLFTTHTCTNLILMNPNHEGNLWVAFEFWSQYHLAIRRIVPLHCSDFSKSFENRLCSSLCSQDLPLQKNKSYPHCDGSYLQPEPWEHHHLHWHHLQPGMGGDLHDYAVRLRSESLPNTRKSVTGHDLYRSVPSHKLYKSVSFHELYESAQI